VSRCSTRLTSLARTSNTRALCQHGVALSRSRIGFRFGGCVRALRGSDPGRCRRRRAIAGRPHLRRCAKPRLLRRLASEPPGLREALAACREGARIRCRRRSRRGPPRPAEPVSTPWRAPPGGAASSPGARRRTAGTR
jgi:hypothetical protein